MERAASTGTRPGLGAPPRRLRLPPRFRRGALIAGSVAGLLAMVVVLWAVDAKAHDDVADRNVTVGDIAVGGKSRAEVAAAVADLAERYAAAPVVIDAPGGGIRANASELGLRVMEDETVDAVMAAGHRGFVLGRFLSWARSFVSARSVTVELEVDTRAVREVVAERDPQRTPPTEPSITSADGRIVAVAGSPGRGIDPAAVVRWVRDEDPGLPLRLELERTSVPPRFNVADANALVAEASDLTREGLEVKAASAVTTVPPLTLRSWLGAEVVDDELRVRVVPDKVSDDLHELMPTAGRPAQDAAFRVSAGTVSITPSATGTACCAPEAASMIEAALRDPSAGGGPVELPLRTLEPDREAADLQKLGVTEAVGAFTTNHPGGEPRVRNIHRMADIVRGSVIEPGATFSLNGTVGPRTTAKGFVEAPVIDDKAMFAKGVGGGVSQFSTTLFNAAFFAGLDITTYGMHDLYITRYPFGREATLDYPSLDLKVRNSTPYGVLIWPTYSETSITVTLYSTRSVVGEQTAQSVEERAVGGDAGPCKRVTTERTRTYNDGRKVVDKFFALYSPKEGVKCPR